MEFFTTLNSYIIQGVDALTGISFSLGHVNFNLYTIVKGLISIIALLWLAGFAMRTADRRLHRVTTMRASNRTLVLKIFQIMLYCVVFMIGMQILGISLAALSVFGGALGVGLGFGLQKIASNFISGLILLFEKSIETGDVIEMSDGTSGFLRQTYARYTVLATPDGKEVLIPNEEFISQRVITWTHSDKFARVTITVGVAYDTDIPLARRLMMEAADAHPRCAPDRPSRAFLTKFDESSIGIDLLFWIADVIDGRMEPKSDIMQAILIAFAANGIDIPYPRRDVQWLNAPAASRAPAAAPVPPDDARSNA